MRSVGHWISRLVYPLYILQKLLDGHCSRDCVGQRRPEHLVRLIFEADGERGVGSERRAVMEVRPGDGYAIDRYYSGRIQERGDTTGESSGEPWAIGNGEPLIFGCRPTRGSQDTCPNARLDSKKQPAQVSASRKPKVINPARVKVRHSVAVDVDADL